MNTKKVFLDFVQRNICRKGKRLQVRYGNCISYTVKNSVHDKGKVKIHGIQHLHDNISHIYLNDGIQSFKVTSREEDTGVTVTL